MDPPPLQEDDDGHLLALQIIRDLVDKGGDVFLDQLARLGVINKVSTLAGPSSDDETEDEAKPEKVRPRDPGPLGPTAPLGPASGQEQLVVEQEEQLVGEQEVQEESSSEWWSRRSSSSEWWSRRSS